jgi:hypothetical protein
VRCRHDPSKVGDSNEIAGQIMRKYVWDAEMKDNTRDLRCSPENEDGPVRAKSKLRLKGGWAGVPRDDAQEWAAIIQISSFG